MCAELPSDSNAGANAIVKHGSGSECVNSYQASLYMASKLARTLELTRRRRKPKRNGKGQLKPKKAAVAPLIRCRGFCFPFWAVFPPLQVVLSSACSVASLSRFPSHYLPGHPHLREGALAAYLFCQGSPSTWCAKARLERTGSFDMRVAA